MSNCHLEIMMGVAWFVCDWDGVTTDTRTPEEILAADAAALEPDPEPADDPALIVPESCEDLSLIDFIMLVTIFAGLAYGLNDLDNTVIVLFTIAFVIEAIRLQLVDCVISYVQNFLAQLVSTVISQLQAAASITDTTFKVGAIAFTSLSIWDLYFKLQEGCSTTPCSWSPIVHYYMPVTFNAIIITSAVLSLFSWW